MKLIYPSLNIETGSPSDVLWYDLVATRQNDHPPPGVLSGSSPDADQTPRSSRLRGVCRFALRPIMGLINSGGSVWK